MGRVRIVLVFFFLGASCLVVLPGRLESGLELMPWLSESSVGLEMLSVCSHCLAAAFGSLLCWIAWSFWNSMYLPSLTETLRLGEMSALESERLCLRVRLIVKM